MAATTSSNCTTFFSLRSSNPSSSGCGSGKLNGVATWLINGVAMVFFASLNRCSCIRVATEEDDDDGDEDANDLPLMLNDGNIYVNGGIGNTRRRRTWKKSRTMVVESN